MMVITRYRVLRIHLIFDTIYLCRYLTPVGRVVLGHMVFARKFKYSIIIICIIVGLVVRITPGPYHNTITEIYFS